MSECLPLRLQVRAPQSARRRTREPCPHEFAGHGWRRPKAPSRSASAERADDPANRRVETVGDEGFGKKEFEAQFEGSRSWLSDRPYLVASKSVEPRTLPDHFDTRADEFAYLTGVVEFPS